MPALQLQRLQLRRRHARHAYLTMLLRLFPTVSRLVALKPLASPLAPAEPAGPSRCARASCCRPALRPCVPSRARLRAAACHAFKLQQLHDAVVRLRAAALARYVRWMGQERLS